MEKSVVNFKRKATEIFFKAGNGKHLYHIVVVWGGGAKNLWSCWFFLTNSDKMGKKFGKIHRFYLICF
jgi:hypothetical protein